MATLLIRTVIVYFALIVMLRLMGKRQIGELEVSELIVTILLSELAAVPITDKDTPLLFALAPSLLLLSLEVILSCVLLRFPKVKTLLAGKPSIVIRGGVLDQQELARQRTGISELLASLRQNGISDIGDVAYAILEQNGKFSVFPKATAGSVTPGQLGIPAEETGIAHALILDRKIIGENLTLAGWNRNRLEQALQKQRLAVEDVFLFSVNDAGETTIIIKETKK